MVQKNHDRYPCKPRYLAGNAYLYSKRGVALAIRYAASLASAVQIRCIAIWSAFCMMTLCMEQAAPPCVFCCASVPAEQAPACRALPSKPGPRPCVFVNPPSPLPKQAAPVHFLQHLYPVRGEAKIAFLRIAHPPSCGLFAGSVPAPRFETAGASSF